MPMIECVIGQSPVAWMTVLCNAPTQLLLARAVLLYDTVKAKGGSAQAPRENSMELYDVG